MWTYASFMLESMRDVAQCQGIVSVIGDIGSGKTTVRRMLTEELRQDDMIKVIMPATIDKSLISAGVLCESIIADLSDESPGRSLEAKERQVERLLQAADEAGQKPLLIIEEAHDLTISALSYIRRLWDLGGEKSRYLGVILIGQPELDHIFREHRYGQANGLIRRSISVKLGPLGADLEGYLKHKLSRVGVDLERVLEPGAVEAIHRRLERREEDGAVSDAYPLAVNLVMTIAMIMAADRGDARVSADHILNA